MAKSSKKKIEEDIKKIIYELKKNSNKSVNDIANKLGFSSQKVWRIIKDLENDNTIWGYTAIVDDNKIGKKRFYILLKRANLPATQEKIDIVVKRDLRQSAVKLGVELENSFFVNGSFDWLMCVTADNIAQVKNLCDSFYSVFGGKYLSDIQVLEVLFPIERNGFDNPKREEFREFF